MGGRIRAKTRPSGALKSTDMMTRPLRAQDVDRRWGRGKVAGPGKTGFSARLTEHTPATPFEVARPACEHTHAVSVWLGGSAFSELHLAGERRFAQTRTRGSFQIARAGESVRAVLSRTTGRCVDLYLPASLIRSALEFENDGEGAGFELLPVGVEQDADISHIAANVVKEIEYPQIGRAAALDAAAMNLSLILMRRWSTLSVPRGPAHVGLSPAQLRRGLAYFSDNLASDISLIDVARAVGLSPFHFARAFKSATGTPPHRYLTELRLEKAQTLLKTTPLSVAEIAASVGYPDPGYFSAVFRKAKGVSPSVFRARS